MVVTITNLHYAEAPALRPTAEDRQHQMQFEYVELDGSGSHGFGEQLRKLEPLLADRWAVEPSPRTGNPIYVQPTAVSIYRSDHRFALDDIIPTPTTSRADYDLIIASQPWRSRTPADFKVRRILAPLSRALRSHGLMLGIQSQGGDPGLEIIRRIWPDEDPFPVRRQELMDALRIELGQDSQTFDISALPDASSLLRYQMHTLPSEIGSAIGTFTLFAAWNAAIYVAQIEDDRVAAAAAEGTYLEATAEVLRERGGLWFDDETFIVQRH